MTIERLRPLPTPDQLAAMYPTPHDHRIYGRGHHERVEHTIALAQKTLDPADRQLVADLSCGNGEIARRICTNQPGGLFLGDFAGNPARPGENGYEGMLEHTILLVPLVDVFILSETIEHLDDPASALARVRAQSEYLVLSTPIECWGDTNGEHLWSWDREGVESLMTAAGWNVLAFDGSVDSREWNEPYWFGIWVCG